MSSKTRRSTKKKSWVIALLAVCLLLAAVGGTVAWLTAQSTLTNQFTVGKIEPIDPNKPGPGDGEPDIDNDPTKLSGNLYEPSWENGFQLTPGAQPAKDPYVGVGAGSEKAYVYVHVTNTMKNNDHVYFTLNPGWEAVDGCTQTVAGEPTQYISGLFKYTAGLDGTGAADGKNVWTGQPLFSKIIVSDDAQDVDFQDATDEEKTGNITVEAFLHQYYDGTGNTALSETSVVLPAVKEAFGID